MQRDRLSEEQVRSRMASQIDPEEARRLATYVIENDGDIVHLRERTRTVYEALACYQVAGDTAANSIT
jgi:dephospho-CoA kinase